MNKVLIVFGTRPEAIKMCPLVLEIKRRKMIICEVCVTGQHRQMLDSVLTAFGVAPEYDLSIMKKGQNLFDITTWVLNGMKRVLEQSQPDLMLVHGDTSTTFAAALAGFYMHIPVGHVEAGLRTNNIYSPYPEEYNRQVTGNTAIDALRTTVTEKYQHSELEWALGSRLIFITAHRRENLGDNMRHMFRAIRRVIEMHSDVKALYPVHMNPAVREIAESELKDCGNIHLVEPLDVIDCHNIMARSYLILTDSGGIQEEAPSLGKPVLVMRDTTERPEGIEAGTLKLVGTDEHTIFDAFNTLLDNRDEYEKMAKSVNPYGDGHACERIADVMEAFFKQQTMVIK